MSHDLHFFKKCETKGSPGFFSSVKNLICPSGSASQETDEEMLRYLGQFRHFSNPDITPDGFDAGYLNPDTGSQFFFNLHRLAIPEFEKENRFAGYAYAGLSCTLNYCRPLFFMLEAAPIIEKFAKKFDLAVLDIQDTQPGQLPKPCQAFNLILSYEKANTASTQSMIKNLGPDAKVLSGTDPTAYLPPEKALFWWEYMFNKHDIDAQMEENDIDLYVPELMILRRNSDGVLLTMMALGEGVGYIVPPCDVFFINRNNNSETGFILASDLIPLLKPYLTETIILNKTFFVLSSENANRFIETLRTLPITDDHEKYTGLLPGSFIDIR